MRSEELLLAIGGASVYRRGVYICEPDRLPSRPARPQPDHSQTSSQTSNTYLIASCIRAPPVLASLMSSLADHAARQSARRRRSATGRDGSARAMSAEGGPRSDRSSRPLPSRRREGRSRSRSRSPYNPGISQFLGEHSWNQLREPTGATTGAPSGQPGDHLAGAAVFSTHKPRALQRPRRSRAPLKIARQGGSKGVATLLDSWGTGDIPGNVVFKVVTNFADDLIHRTQDITESMHKLLLPPDTM